jgi:hypothetical protein
MKAVGARKGRNFWGSAARLAQPARLAEPSRRRRVCTEHTGSHESVRLAGAGSFLEKSAAG